MKERLAVVERALGYWDFEDGFWTEVSKLDGRGLALVMMQRPDAFDADTVDEHHVDFKKLTAADYVMLLSHVPSLARSLRFESGLSIWDRDASISKCEIAPGIRWFYTVRKGFAYIVGTRGLVSSAEDREWANGQAWLWHTDGMEQVENIIVPASVDGVPVRSFGRDTFEGFYGLNEIRVAEGVVGVDGFAFYSGGNPRKVSLPDSLRYIGAYAFMCCPCLRDINIPSGCRSIGSKAFSGCCRMERIVIPKSVQYIGDEAFLGCENLQEIVIECDACRFGKGMLNGCSSVKRISGPGARQFEAACMM